MGLVLQVIPEVQKNLRANSPALDTTLQVNRDAIATCQNLTKCPYDKDICFRTVACGLIGLVLSSYQAALEHFYDDNIESGQLRSGSKTKKPELTLGGFSIEREDQKTFVKEIVKKEVRKIRELSSAVLVSGTAGIEEQHLAETMMTYLDRKTQAVIFTD